MKNIAYIILWGMILAFPACKSEDLLEEYLVPNGRLYPAKALNAQARSGDNRIEVSWLNGSDPKVVKARVSWNNGAVWEEMDITTDMDTIRKEIKPLAETTYSFMIRTYDAKGNISVPVEVIGRAYGEKYKKSLLSRTLKNAVYNADAGTMQLEWYDAEATETGIELEYTDSNDQIRKITVANTETTATIPNLKGGSMVYYSSRFKPNSLAIDEFSAPKSSVPYYANITAQALKNTEAPFAKGDMVNSSNRFYLAENWSANSAAAANGNVDTHELYPSFLTLLTSSSLPYTTILNGKLYQTVEQLEAGSYRFDVWVYRSQINAPATTWVYIAAALGDDLPDATDVQEESLGYVRLSNNTGNRDVLYSIDYKISEKRDVSLGFVVNATQAGQTTQIVITRVALWKLIE